MSKLYDTYVALKRNESDNNILYLFKSGIFFIFIDQDAIIASKLLNLKLTLLNASVYKCGFPISSLEKYSSLIEPTYTLKIIDNTQSISYKIQEYNYNSDIISLLDTISNVDTDNLSIKEAYAFISDIQNTADIIKNSILRS